MKKFQDQTCRKFSLGKIYSWEKLPVGNFTYEEIYPSESLNF